MIRETITPPAIVVAAYNRPDALERLLGSLNNAHYPPDIPLIISIDYSGGNDVRNIAEDYKWHHGQKKIIAAEKKLGLRKHILQCGDLTNSFENIILLEDDLYVSPWFYDFAVKALTFYLDDENLAGISLYSHAFNETASLPFTPLCDGADVFFLQLPSSWGQVWTQKQWKLFRRWYADNGTTILKEDALPKNITDWEETSWKKYFVKYMFENKLYFVYPRVSLTTNFGDAGTHMQQEIQLFQRPLQFAEMNYRFIAFDDSFCKYDSHCEILPGILNHFHSVLDQYDYAVDLYGTKDIHSIPEDYILTSRRANFSILSYGRKMKPLEMNIIENIKGDDLVLCRPSDIVEDTATDVFNKKSLFYHYAIMEHHYSIFKQAINILDFADHLSILEMLKIFLATIKKRLTD